VKFVSRDEVLYLLKVSFIVRKRRLGILGHVARLSHTVPASQILRICTKARGGEWPSQEWRRACCSHPPPGFTRSAMTRVSQWPRPCSWRRIDCSGRRSQQQEASTERYVSWWWWWCFEDKFIAF